MLAALIGIGLGTLEQAGRIASSWRAMFLVGTLPALLWPVHHAPPEGAGERWRLAAKDEDGQAADRFSELFATPRWRRNAIVGMLLAFSGVVGLWGIGFFSFDLIRSVFDDTSDAARACRSA